MMADRLTIALIIGHTEKSPGARAIAPLFKTEYDYNTDLAAKIAELLIHEFNCVILRRDGLTIEEAYGKAFELDPDCCIELHFNSSENHEAMGTEVLCIPRWSSIAKMFQKALCDALMRDVKTDRGIKILNDPTDRGYRSVSALPVPSVLIEPFFGSNEIDARLGLEKQDKIAQAVYNACWTWFLFDSDSIETKH